MNKKLFVRKAHRYIGLFLSLQLLAWTIGGIWFTWNNIDNIHGDHLRKNHETNINSENLKSPQMIFDTLSDFKNLNHLSLVSILEKTYYKLNYLNNENISKTILIDANSGITQTQITKKIAISIAKESANFDANISTVDFITETNNHHEFRNKPLPAWAITFDYPSSPTFYVSAEFGTLVAIRHNSWRIFDFLWMLHTMDYQSRDFFGNWLIKIFSIIALMTGLSGIFLFFSTRRKTKN